MCILIENIAFLNHQLQPHSKYSWRRKTFLLFERSAWCIFFFFFPLWNEGIGRGGGCYLKKKMIHRSPCLTLRNRASHHEWWTDPAAERGSSHWLSWLGSWCSHQVESGSFPSYLELCLQARVSCLQLGRKGSDGATEPRRAPPGLGTRGGGSCWRAWLQGRQRAPSLNPSDLNLSSYRVSLVTNCPYLKCVSVCLPPPLFFPFLSPPLLSSLSLFFFFFFSSVFWCWWSELTPLASLLRDSCQVYSFTSTAPLRDFDCRHFLTF